MAERDGVLSVAGLQRFQPEPDEPMAVSIQHAEPSVLKPIEVAAIAQLRERLDAEMASWPAAAQREAKAHVDDFTLARFVQARDFKLDDALHMFRESMAWRSVDQRGVGRIFAHYHPALPDASASLRLAAARAHSYQGFSGVAKDGSPILIERLGRVDLDGISREGKPVLDLMLDAYVCYLETAFRLVREASDATGRLVKAIIIVDASGIGLSLIRNLSIIKTVASIGPPNYPEVTHKVLIVNAPRVASMAWAIISPLLPSHTREKVKVLGSSTSAKKAIFEMIDEDQLPKFLGGSRPDAECKIARAEPIPVGLGAQLAAAREERHVD
jgi:hypothetical protein